MDVIIWGILFVLFLVIEAVTLALVTIWFAGGALLGLIAALLGAPVWLQIAIFVVSSTIMLITIFPIARKKLHVGKAKTNVDDLIGKIVVVTKPITFNTFGQVSINGVLWSATGEDSFAKDETVQIKAIEGNKVIIAKYNPTC